MELFKCPLLSARLTRDACGKRWNVANSTGTHGYGSMGIEYLDDLRVSGCKGCALGKIHAQGVKTHRPNVRNVVCIGCGISFEARSPNHRFCTKPCQIRDMRRRKSAIENTRDSD